MSDRELIADRLVRQKAILDVLREADADTRAEARALYAPGAADPTPLGRVRMDKGRKAHTVTDWAALERWVRTHIPDGIVVRESVSPALVTALCRDGGEWADPATGELIPVDGIAITEGEGRLVVTTAPEAEDWARAALAPFVAPELDQ